MLQTITDKSVFHEAIPELPMGKYAHYVLLRETSSYPLFQTDGELNLARVSAGLSPDNQAPVSRIVIFKRKQSTPERLTGRELLRAHGIIAASKKEEQAGKGRYCEYNSADFCKECPDCILYGFAIGALGSERSKVLVDSAFSLTGYDESHEQMTFNAPFETGTMGKAGVMKTAIGEQDHVLPQVYFPAVVTLKDPIEAGFLYVFNNILRTRRYGAQSTRTGTIDNHVLAVIFADGEIFSNLKLSQKVTDILRARTQFDPPLQLANVRQAMVEAIPKLLFDDRVVAQVYNGDRLDALLKEINGVLGNEDKLAAFIKQIATQARQYAEKHGVLSSSKKQK
jgi:CRISPR-associated protein Csc2